MDTENRTSRKRNAFATALLTTLAFALGFAEFVLIGITPDVAEGLGEPLTLIGDLVGYYALACAVATPIVALATARADRFKVMAALLVVFNAGNLLTLFADGYALLLVSRVLPAVTSGTLLALALTYVPDMWRRNAWPPCWDSCWQASRCQASSACPSERRWPTCSTGKPLTRACSCSAWP